MPFHRLFIHTISNATPKYCIVVLNGDRRLEKFTKVAIRCEIIRFEVLCFVCDTRGPSACLVKLLHQKEVLPWRSWLPKSAIWIVKPHSKSWYISLFCCATHDLKAIRTMLFTSWPEYEKNIFPGQTYLKIRQDIMEEHLKKIDRKNFKILTHFPRYVNQLWYWTSGLVWPCGDQIAILL